MSGRSKGLFFDTKGGDVQPSDCWWTSGGSQGEGPGTNKGATGPLLPLNRKAALSAALSMLSGVLFRHALGVLVDLLGGQPFRLGIRR